MPALSPDRRRVGARFDLTLSAASRRRARVLGRQVIRPIGGPADVAGLDAALAADALSRVGPGVRVLLVREPSGLHGVALLVVAAGHRQLGGA